MLAGMSAAEKKALHLTVATDYYYLTQVKFDAALMLIWLQTYCCFFYLFILIFLFDLVQCTKLASQLHSVNFDNVVFIIILDWRINLTSLHGILKFHAGLWDC